MLQQTYDFDTAVRVLGDSGGTLRYRGERNYVVVIRPAAFWPPVYPWRSAAWWASDRRGEHPEHRTRGEWIAQVREHFSPAELAGPWVIDERYTPLVGRKEDN